MNATWLGSVVAVLFASAGFWAFLRSMRGATSAEYQSFVRDLQAERKDRQEAIGALQRQIKRQDARIRRQARKLAEQDLDFRQMEAHISALEAVIVQLGGTPPARPARVRIEAGDDEEEFDDEASEDDAAAAGAAPA